MTAESADGVATRVNVQAVNADIKTVIQALADLGRFNVVFADGAEGRVGLGAGKMVGPPLK